MKKFLIGLAAFIGVSAAAGGVIAHRVETEDAFVMDELFDVEESSAPVMHIGTTMRTTSPRLPQYLGANIQYVIRDDVDKDRPLNIRFRIADDDLTNVVMYDGLKQVYEKTLDEMVGTVNADIRYTPENSGFHIFRIEARDASGNLTRSVFATQGNEILVGTFPGDTQQPFIYFADGENSWYEHVEGNGYAGKVHISDKSEHVLDDSVQAPPPLYGFSSKIFDEDLTHLTVLLNGRTVYDAEYVPRELDRRQVKNPAEVHFLFTLLRDGRTYDVSVIATDGAGHVTEETRTVTTPTE